MCVHPIKPHFHFFPAAAGPSGKPIQVHVKDLKAVVFMKDLARRRKAASSRVFVLSHTVSEVRHPYIAFAPVTG